MIGFILGRDCPYAVYAGQAYTAEAGIALAYVAADAEDGSPVRLKHDQGDYPATIVPLPFRKDRLETKPSV